MDERPNTTDQPVLARIQQLVEDEHRLYERSERGLAGVTDQQLLENIQVELDRCWDLLRQRRALRGAGQNPDEAQARPADVVEKYEQ